MLRLTLIVILSAVVASVSTVKADWINLTGAETAPTIAEIYVLDDHVKLVLEVYIGDLRVFEELIPDDWLHDRDVPRPVLAERLRVFSSKTFQFITETGEKLPAQLQLVEPRTRTDRKSPFAGMINPMTRQRVPEAPADKRVLYAELVYPFQEKPKALTIVPPLDDEGRAVVTIGFIAYHKAVPIIDFRYLGAPARVALNWDDPWYTTFDNPNLKRHHKTALMSFLYVEPYEVRHEILTRVKDLEQWIDLGLRGKEYIEPDELAPLKQRIGAFLVHKNKVRIDGKARKPILDRTNYVKVALTGIQLLENPERLEISTAIVGVILSYITPGLPQKVTVDWELFTEQMQRVPATAIDPAGPLLSYLEPQDNVHTWTNYLKNYQLPTVDALAVAGSLGRLTLPVGSLICLVMLIPVGWQLGRRRRRGQPLTVPLGAAVVLLVGTLVVYPYTHVSVAKPATIAGTLKAEPAQVLLHTLLRNVYRAFDFRAEEDVYDKLALSVSGELLTNIYLQNRKAFAVQQAGGAQAKIKQIDILETTATKKSHRPLTFAFTAKWTAMGTVGHWGHVHTRKNLYDAIVTVEAVEGHWKITGLELLEEQRVDPLTQTARK